MHQGHMQMKTCVQRQGYACKGRVSVQRLGTRRQGCMCEDGGAWEDRVGVTNSLLVQQQWYVLNREGVEGTDKSEGGTRGRGCSTPRGGGEG
jgi:hypothetical protein